MLQLSRLVWSAWLHVTVLRTMLRASMSQDAADQRVVQRHGTACYTRRNIVQGMQSSSETQEAACRPTQRVNARHTAGGSNVQFLFHHLPLPPLSLSSLPFHMTQVAEGGGGHRKKKKKKCAAQW